MFTYYIKIVILGPIRRIVIPGPIRPDVIPPLVSTARNPDNRGIAKKLTSSCPANVEGRPDRACSRVCLPDAAVTEEPPMTQRLSTGIAGLDDVLRGGLIPGEAYVIRGASGTGKTTLGVQFLVAGARRGEPT